MRAKAPGPRGLPLLGSVLELRRDVLGTLERAMLDHGDVVRFTAGPMVIHAVFHPDGVRRVLASNARNYRKDNQGYAETARLFGDGLLTSQDDAWLAQRRTVQPLFTPRTVANYLPVMADESHRLARRWRERNRVDLHDEMVAYAMRVVGRILFGDDMEEATAILREAFPVLSEQAFRRGLAPVLIPAHWPTPANRKAAAARRRMFAVADELVRRRQTRASGDLLSALLQARDPETGVAFDDRHLADQVLVFLLAGHETTATTLTFALYLLGRHPEVQEAVRDEVAGRDLDADLPLTEMVIKEALRLYPPAYVIPRLAAEGDKIGGYEIPPGSTVAASPWATHRHPAFWDHPDRFDPSRFSVERDRYAYFPFGGGPRACIGMQFALVEATVALAVLLQEHRIGPPDELPPLSTGLTLSPGGPVTCPLLS